MRRERKKEGRKEGRGEIKVRRKGGDERKVGRREEKYREAILSEEEEMGMERSP